MATVNALHWFDAGRATQLVEYVHAPLRSGGLSLLAEPAWPETPFVEGFEQWKAKLTPRCTHTTLLGPRQANRIGEDGMSVAGWIRLLERAGFELIDVLLRDADQVVISALKTIELDGR